MSKGGRNQTVTQKTDIPEFILPFLRQQQQIGTSALGRLEGQLAGAGSEQLVAPFTPLQQRAQTLGTQRALGVGGFIPTAQQQFLQTAQGTPLNQFLDPTAFDALQRTAGGDFLFGGQGFDQAVQAAIRQAQPAILSAFGGAGRGTGGLAQTAIAQTATDAFARQFGDERQRQLAAAGLLGGFGESERGRQLAAAGALPGLAFADVDALEAIGASQQAQRHRELLAPISANEQLLSLALSGFSPQSFFGLTESKPLFRNPLVGALGGGALGFAAAGGGAAAGGAAGAAGGAATGSAISPGIGTLIGAILGGLLS